MTTGISRRQFHTALGWGAASIALAELGLSRPALAEENFTVASTGASWGEGLKAAFIDGPKFEETSGAKVTQVPPGGEASFPAEFGQQTHAPGLFEP